MMNDECRIRKLEEDQSDSSSPFVIRHSSFVIPRSPPPFRVLMVVESAAGGTGRHVLDLSEGLIVRGCDVHLVYSTGRVDRFFLDRLAEIPGLRRTALRMRTGIHPSDLGAALAVRRYLREHGPFDAVHGHSS